MKLDSKERNIWWTSDLHYWHKNITYGESVWKDKENTTRKFETTKEMSHHLVSQINKYVGIDDILFFLGDWSFSGIENIWNLRKQLNVKEIHFISGNHDHHIINDKVLPNCWVDDNDSLRDKSEKRKHVYNDWRDGLFNVTAKQIFTSVNDYLEIVVDKTPVMMFHRPIEDWHDQKGKVYHLHGHTHGTLPVKPYRLDVGIDNAYKLFGEYRPFSWDDIKKHIKPNTIVEEKCVCSEEDLVTISENDTYPYGWDVTFQLCTNCGKQHNFKIT